MANTKQLKGSKTEKNLANAFVSEATAYARYSFFAKSAEKESYFHFANIFNETADNELRHAKVFLKFLTEGAVTTAPVNVDPGILSPTVDNLKVAVEEEQKEGVEQYSKFAKEAEKEEFSEIAEKFREIASIENHHKERFDEMRRQIEADSVWEREKPIKWQCLVCGYIFEGKKPPKKCPACDHPYQHFMPADGNI